MDEERKLLPHTPAPWRLRIEPYEDDPFPGKDFFSLRIGAGADEDTLTGITAPANARLIAAAPELYERVQSSSIALEEAAKLLEGHGLSGCASIMRGYIAGNNAALAKARGESNTRSGGTSDE